MHRLARKLSPKSEVTASQPGQSLPGSLGTVQSVNGDGTATVVYMGAPIPCQCLGDFVPAVGQGVLVLVEGQRNWCIGPIATAPAIPWTTVTSAGLYGSGWSDQGSGGFDVGFRLVGDQVQLRGIAAGGSSGNTIFTLPSEPSDLAPSSLVVLVVDSATAFGIVHIATTGVVTAASGAGSAGSTSGLSLDGLSFSLTP